MLKQVKVERMAQLTDAEILQRARDHSPFNLVFVEARIRRDMTRGDVARKTGFTNSFVRSYEEVALNPTVDTLQRYCDALALTFYINRNGLTIHDLALGQNVLENWRRPEDEEWPDSDEEGDEEVAAA
jgi:transcriptional regulator with XRE-family HTH domain